MNNKSIVLIPAYKPDIHLIQLVQNLSKAEMNVLVVDDGSKDEYKKIFMKVKEYAQVITCYVNQGKGRALKTGYEYILENTDYENVITADADGQHTVNDIIKINKKLVTGKKFIIGSREFQGQVPLRSRLGNGITRFLFRIASGISIMDTQTGLRGFKRVLLGDMIKIDGDRYEYEMNVLLWAAKNNIEITEEKIETVYEKGNKSSHFNPIKDSIKIYSKIIKYCFSSLIAFLVDFILLFILKAIFNNLIISIVCARVVSSSVNFIINRNIVFSDKGSITKQYIKYASLVVFILGLNCMIMTLLNEVIGINLFLTKLITETLLFMLSYFIQNKLIFKTRKLDNRRKVN